MSRVHRPHRSTTILGRGSGNRFDISSKRSHLIRARWLLRLSHFCQALLTPSTTQALESFRRSADFVTLPTPHLEQFVVTNFDHATVTVDECREALDCLHAAFDSDSAFGCVCAGRRIGCQPSFGFIEAPLQETFALVQAGTTHF